MEHARAFDHGRWKYCRKGDKKLLFCNALVACQVKLCVARSGVGSSFCVLVSNLAHNLELDIRALLISSNIG